MLIVALTTLGALLGCGAVAAGRRRTVPVPIPVRVRPQHRRRLGR